MMDALKQNEVKRLSQEALLETLTKVEEAVIRGSAQFQDYENYVVCQKELLRRGLTDAAELCTSSWAR